MATVHGKCLPQFHQVEKLLGQNIASGEELGASICVNVNGTNVIDIWGGHADTSRSRPWERDTIAPVWSITKCVTNLAALILIDRGLLDPEAKVAEYWPEFAANGKENVLVRHILGHTSGVAGWDATLTIEEICDVPEATAKLAKQEPWWTPGTASGYQMTNHGHLVGELVRRASGKPLEEFIQSEIVDALGGPDFHFVIEDGAEPVARIAELQPPSMQELKDMKFDELSNLTIKAIGPLSSDPVGTASSAIFRSTPWGASAGFGNAASVVQVLSSAIAASTHDDQKSALLSDKTIARIFEPQATGADLVLGMPITFGLGFALITNQPGEALTCVPRGEGGTERKCCWWVGWGGSVAIVDLDNKMTMCYVPNKMGMGFVGTARTEAYVRAVYSALPDLR